MLARQKYFQFQNYIYLLLYRAFFWGTYLFPRSTGLEIYIECGLLHITYSISAELFINFNTKTVFFLCSRCCFNNSRTPGAHVAPWPQVGCSGTLTWDLQFCLWNCYMRADVSNEVVTPFCVLDMASRGCKRLFLFDWFNTSFTFHISSAFIASFFVQVRDCFHRLDVVIWRIS